MTRKLWENLPNFSPLITGAMQLVRVLWGRYLVSENRIGSVFPIKNGSRTRLLTFCGIYAGRSPDCLAKRRVIRKNMESSFTTLCGHL